MSTKIPLSAAALILCVASLTYGQATAPVTQTLQATITKVVGSAHARQSEKDPWETAKVGMKLNEGAEIRTNIRSQVVYHIPPDQNIVLDRLGTVKLLLARGNGKEVQTRLGMSYGRTQYLVEDPGLQHDAEITSPGATLAVRGTKEMLLFDQGPFAPIAYASQPVKLRNDRGQTVAFGKPGKRAHVAADKTSPAEQSLVERHVDPAGKFAARTEDENKVLTYLTRVAPGLDLSQYRLLALIADPNFKGTAAAVLPIKGQLQFTMFWQDIIKSDLDLAVISPTGERVSFTNPKVKSSGHHLGNGVADKSGFGQESIVWETSYPFGKYTIEVSYKNAKSKSVTAQTFVIRDPLTKGEQVASFSDQVSRTTPAIHTVNIPAPPKGGGGGTPAAARRK